MNRRKFLLGATAVAAAATAPALPALAPARAWATGGVYPPGAPYIIGERACEVSFAVARGAIRLGDLVTLTSERHGLVAAAYRVVAAVEADEWVDVHAVRDRGLYDFEDSE